MHVSLTEGVPATVIEALGSGTPVVATAVGGVPAALEHGNAGLLVPPSDLDALVDAIGGSCTIGSSGRAWAAHGLEVAAAWTLDANAMRVARFIASASGAC